LLKFVVKKQVIKSFQTRYDPRQESLEGTVKGRGHGSISKVSMTSLLSSETDDVFEDVNLDRRNQYNTNNENLDSDKLSSMINLTEQKITIGPSKIIRPNIILTNNDDTPKEIESSLLNLSGSLKVPTKSPKFWNRSTPLKTLIMPHSIVERKNQQKQPEANEDLTDEEVMELTKYVEKYISNSNFRDYMKNNLQSETLFVTDHPSLTTTTKKVPPTTMAPSTTITTTIPPLINKKFRTNPTSKEKLKQFKEQFNKWLDELRKKASNISKGIEIKDSPNPTINENFVLKSNSTFLQKPNLVETSMNILVDTGMPSIDVLGKKSTRIEILRKLNELLLSPNDIHYVIITSSQIDHIGNLNEFGNAIIFQNNFIFDQKKGAFTIMNIKNNDYLITPNVRITKGYGENINVIVKSCKNFKEIVSITGDHFINEYDIFNPNLWKPFSSNVEVQEYFRKKILCSTDWIVPGHGNIFKVDIKFKERFC
uniref:Metallo-beta-lactamase domain-containing protein 1 n=1 Tax=Strongyloides stercoralis TaxID=6248 RepID=A0AAF5DG40_STRER